MVSSASASRARTSIEGVFFPHSIWERQAGEMPAWSASSCWRSPNRLTHPKSLSKVVGAVSLQSKKYSSEC